MPNKAEELKEKGICPSCHNMKYGGIFADITERLLYEDDLLLCFLEENPRSIGHTIILIKPHYHDMSEIPDELCSHVYCFAKKVMNALLEASGAERVYLCTMCDGPVNHYHVQLIPRHHGVKIGSYNFVNPREKYIHNEAIVCKLRMLLNS
ncbi:HIT family protein [Ruminococcaceae bacterium OttesenSCG-928-L11]|nr:HIT family protein [Ruminococcaceae bacterium OttesenSCG-928-L11]